MENPRYFYIYICSFNHSRILKSARMHSPFPLCTWIIILRRVSCALGRISAFLLKSRIDELEQGFKAPEAHISGIDNTQSGGYWYP